jgi:hypothetical protein
MNVKTLVKVGKLMPQLPTPGDELLSVQLVLI